MSGDYIAVLSPRDAGSDASSRARDATGYIAAIDVPGLLVLTKAGTDLVELTGRRGAVVGTMFDRSSRAPLQRLDVPVAEAAFASEGSSLLQQFWGGFVTFLALGEGRTAVIRDPSGERPCYWVRRGDAMLVTSAVRDCAVLGLIKPDFNWRSIAGHLLWPERRPRDTCLLGVCELMPGERLMYGPAGTIIDAIWQPWHFTTSETRIDGREEAVELVRRATLNTISGWCTRHPKPLVSLSGGLDSSIVAAGAKDHAVAAVTLMTEDAIGDERQYARAAADQCSVPLLERPLTLRAIDPRRSNAAPLPRPVSRMFGQAADTIWRDTVAETGADALFHGGGGDNVFCYLTSSVPYLDSLLVRGPGRESGTAVRDLAKLTQVSIWRVRRAALRKFVIDRGRFRWHHDARLLTPNAVTLGGTLPHHPWFEKIPPYTLPGKRAHVAALVRIQNYLDAIVPERSIPVVAPLMSQQVMETCLRVPTWMWCENGTNRAIARAAFANALPPLIIERTGKGGPDVFEAQIINVHRAAIREMLLNGLLATHGIIDRRAVATALGEEGPCRGTLYSRLSSLVDVEAWLQSWAGIRGTGPTAQA